MPPPPPSEITQVPAVCPAPGPSLLAPPPGFSDSEGGSQSDTDSLHSEPGNFKRFGFTRVSKPRSLAVPSLTEQLRKERTAAQVARDAAKRSRDSTNPGGVQKQFRTKNLRDWSGYDVCEWLDSLFMPEYKTTFLHNQINGRRLAELSVDDFDRLGVVKVGHRLNIQKSIKRYMPR